MWILPLVGYLGVVVGFCFLTLAIASGLYYLSELVEEHTVIARRLLSRLIYGVIAIQILLLLFDKFPFSLSLLSIGSHIVYASNLRRFPIVKLTDPFFILSCFLVGLNHWLWFRHFSKPSPPPRSPTNWRQPYNVSSSDMPTFTEVASYFGLCVWLVPFALFVSLSAGENVLPTMGFEYATGEPVPTAGRGRSSLGVDGKNKTKGMAKALVDGVRGWVSENGELMGFWKGDRAKRF
ncbi:transmembrane adaptor Erv26 [Aspergillus desertorum]